MKTGLRTIFSTIKTSRISKIYINNMFKSYHHQLSNLFSKVNNNRKALIVSSFPYLIDVILPGIIDFNKSETEVYVSLEESIGRYLFLLLEFLSSGGNTVTFLNKLCFWDYLDKYGKLSLKLNNVIFSKNLPSNSEDKILIYQLGRPELMRRKWKKMICVNFDISSSPVESEDWMLMPCPMHPLVYISAQHEKIYYLRENTRKIKIFFAGNIDTSLYVNSKNNYLREKFKKLLRPEIIQTVISNLEGEVLIVEDEKQIRLALEGNYPGKCIVVDKRKFCIPNLKWLDVLSKSDFFLCPPGVYMPLCHNAAEAMAVGTIPIINYAEWFKPRLEHLKTCIEFTNEEDLIYQVKRALTMDRYQINKIRNNVIEYYENYMSPKSFQKQILYNSNDKIDLFINAGQVPYLQKINGKSVIFSYPS